MNTLIPSPSPGSPKPASLFLLIAVLLPFFVMACKTSSETDWNSRVGHYTYDQALKDLGNPRTTQVQPDGTRVAEWMTRHGRPAAAEYGLNPSYGTPGIRENQAAYETSQFPPQYLRLTFAPDGTLKSWRESAK